MEVNMNRNLRQYIRCNRDALVASEKNLKAIFEIADDMVAQNALPCTACRYCEEKCPKKLPIPQIFAEYNAKRSVVDENVPAACIGCKQCEAVCPQEIKIASVMTYLKAKAK